MNGIGIQSSLDVRLIDINTFDLVCLFVCFLFPGFVLREKETKANF